MDLNNIFLTDDIKQIEKDKIIQRVQEQVKEFPLYINSYVLVEKLKGKVRIRFFRKDRVDATCRQASLTPKQFIFDLFKECTNPNHSHSHEEPRLMKYIEGKK